MKNNFFCPKLIITVTLLCIVLLLGCQRQPTPNKEIYVVFRLDDYSAKSSIDLEMKIIEVFRKHGDSLTFAVIPFVNIGNERDLSSQNILPLAKIKIDILKNALKDGTVDIALHGFSHQTINAEKVTEFKGLDSTLQLEKLTKGKNFLESMLQVPVRTFVPPWNSYDLNTLRILEQLGFSTISAKLNFGEVIEETKLKFLPAVAELPQLRDAVKAARISSDDQPIVVVLFHHYDFKENDEKLGIISYRDFSELLNWLKSQKDVRILSIGQATEIIDDLSANRVVLNRQNNRLLTMFFPSSFRIGENNLYVKKPVFQKNFVRVGGFYFTIFGFWAVFSFLVGYFTFRKFEFTMNICAFGSIALAVILLIYAFHDLQVGVKGMVVSVVGVATSVGLCLSVFYFRKRKSPMSD